MYLRLRNEKLPLIKERLRNDTHWLQNEPNGSQKMTFYRERDMKL